MSEQRKIPTTTIVTVDTSSVQIFTYYNSTQEELPYTLSVIITNNVGSSNGISYLENELIMTMINHPSNIDFVINSNGELIVFTPLVEDADRYSIDSEGNLIYTTP